MRKFMVGAGVTLALLGATSALSQQAGDPLTKPIAPDYAKQWLGPAEPIRVFGNSYLIGFAGMNVGLIKTDAGLIVLDAALPQSIPQLEAHIRALGFRLRDVKLILSTEPHFDHAGGMAALSRDTGAPVLAGAGALPALSGKSDPADPQAEIYVKIPAVTRLRAVRPGEKIRLGNVEVTAVATPGHTRGSTSWTWRSCEGRRCANIVFAASLNPVSGDHYRFTDHPEIVAQLRNSLATVAALKCDILFTTHPDQSDGDVKRKAFEAGRKSNPFLDPGACRAYTARVGAKLDARLAKERAGK